MNAPRWLLTPWIAAPASMRWLSVIIATLSVIIALGIALWRGTSTPATAAVYALTPAAGVMWTFILPNMLLLQLQGRRLCLPGISRDITLSMGAYALLTTLAPAFLLAWLGADFATGALILALVACGGLLYVLLPWYLAMACCLLPMWGELLPIELNFAAPGQSGFVTWALPTVAALACVGALRWWQVTHYAVPATSWLRRPLIYGLNQNLRMTVAQGGSAYSGDADPTDPLQMLRMRPDWLQRRPDLRRTGPGFVQRSLRVALGGPYLPQTWQGWVAQSLPGVLVFTALAAIFALNVPATSSERVAAVVRVWHLGDGAAVVWFVGLTGTIGVAACHNYLQRLWSANQGELSLLALLPNLGDTAVMRYQVQRAVLGTPLRVLVTTLLIMLALCLAARQSGLVVGFVLLSVLGSAAACWGLALRVLAGTAQTLWARVLAGSVYAGMIILVSFSTIWPMATFPALSPSIRLDFEIGLVTGWLVLGGGMLWLGYKGRRHFMQQAHPFLAH